jgi:ATP-dependent DNA ligase
MNEVRLYRKNANSLGSWRIWSEGAKIRIAHATVLGGSEVFHAEVVAQNLSGRTLQEQVALRMRSRISRMRDRGYKDTIEEASRDQSNQLGLDRPMLAYPIMKVPNVQYSGAVLQKKLDGHRCLITCQDGDIIAYSRQGKRIDAIRHILRGIRGRIPEGTTIDGELYCHGYSLQTLASWIKREQANTYNLYFVGYDLISNDRYIDRHAELSEIVAGADTEAAGKIVALPYRSFEDHETTSAYFREVREQGFEGLMLRTDGRGYEIGRRSTSLLKIKEFQDEEFEVVGFKRSKEGWAICKCRTKDGGLFSASAPGDLIAKQAVWINQEKYLGKMLTVEFAFYTEDNVPFQPTAVRWRVDV